MSGNINDTDVEKIESQAKSMLIDANSLEYTSEELESKYRWLSKRFPTLFNYIKSDYQKFDINTLNLMLNIVKKVQKKETTQENASKLIGTKVARDYIPDYILKDKPTKDS